MSVQPPPTNTTTPVYNPIFYIDPTSSSGIDVAFLDANYLKFPTAQGSEDFTNGLFSTDTIDFNSATGANRAITNVSKTEFSDILGNALYTASIEENSTAIGIYDGGLIINSSNSINLVATDILANGVPIGTGGGNVSTTSNNTFLSPATTQTFNNQNIIISNNGTIEIGGFAGGNPTPSYIYFPTTFPTGSTGNNGLSYFWNNSDGGGEVSMICYAQGAGGGTTSAGGLQIYSVNSSPNAPQLLASFLYGSSSISTNPTIPTSTTIGTLTASQTATTYLLNTTYAPLASPALTGNPTAPTATAGDSSTNIATTAFVSNAISSISSNFVTTIWTASLNGSNTQWSGYIPLSVTMNTFSFYFYSNTQSNNTSLAPGDQIVSGNSQFTGFGIAARQNYITAGATQYGYIFTILNYNGLSISSPSLTMYSVAMFPPSALGCCFGYLTNVNDGGYFYSTANNGLTIVITQY